MDMKETFGIIVGFPLLSIIIITTAVMIGGTVNDHLLYDLNGITPDLVSNNVISNTSANNIDNIVSGYASTLSVIDYAWFLAFILMFLGTCYTAYFSEKINILSMLSILFFVSIILFYILGVYLDFTLWFKEEVLLNLLPTANSLLSLFNYYIEYLGIITMIQLGLVLLLNQIDFNLVKFSQRKDKELATIEDNEVL